MKTFRIKLVLVLPLLLLLLCSWGSVPVKQYYMLNYIPTSLSGRLVNAPYPFTLRLKDFDIEDAYNRTQIVYRQSPYELRYYFYKQWAVKPSRMITDLVQKHLSNIGFMSHVIRRFDEGLAPDYELSGVVESLEEYDSDQLWFAHLALRMTLTRVSDGRVLYSRKFDNRKRVYKYSPDNVVREMSAILEFIMNQALYDLDQVFSKEYGRKTNASEAADSTRLQEIQRFRGEGGE